MSDEQPLNIFKTPEKAPRVYCVRVHVGDANVLLRVFYDEGTAWAFKHVAQHMVRCINADISELGTLQRMNVIQKVCPDFDWELDAHSLEAIFGDNGARHGAKAQCFVAEVAFDGRVMGSKQQKRIRDAYCAPTYVTPFMERLGINKV